MSKALFLICLFFTLETSAQTTPKNWIVSYGVGITKLDFFTGLKVGKNFKNWAFYSSGELGVNRTFFQQRFFPKISFQGNYYYLSMKKIRLSMGMSYAFSICKINTLNNRFHRWNEYYTVTKMQIGNRFFGITELQIGLLEERFYSSFEQSIKKFYTPGFNLSIGLGYAF
jgi:hypothetical protein